MAKSRTSIPSILEAVKEIKKGKLKPVYYFSGDDSFGIETAFKVLEEKLTPLLTSDFDKEVFYGENKTLSEILDAASAFPFGSSKKFVVVRESEKIKDKKNLLSYADSPPEFTIIIFLHYGKISNPDSQVYKKLIDGGFLFESKELKGKNLVNWLVDFVESKEKILSEENAQLLIDIAGENRNVLEAQLEKIITFLDKDVKEINHRVIIDVSSSLKEYTIFDLQNAISRKDKAHAYKIGNKLVESGVEPTFIIYMLTRYFTGLSRIKELKEQNLPIEAAARIVGTHRFYYNDYLKARAIYTDAEVFSAIKALLKADLSIKTTSSSSASIISILIAEIIS